MPIGALSHNAIWVLSFAALSCTFADSTKWVLSFAALSCTFADSTKYIQSWYVMVAPGWLFFEMCWENDGRCLGDVLDFIRRLFGGS